MVDLDSITVVGMSTSLFRAGRAVLFLRGIGPGSEFQTRARYEGQLRAMQHDCTVAICREMSMNVMFSLVVASDQDEPVDDAEVRSVVARAWVETASKVRAGDEPGGAWPVSGVGRERCDWEPVSSRSQTTRPRLQQWDTISLSQLAGFSRTTQSS